MSKKFRQSPESLLNSDAGRKISAKKEELEQLANSKDGQKVRQMLDGKEQKLKSAVENGDTATLKSALSDILKTDEGARLANRLSELMKQ
jgi:hypothetical protein